MRHPPRPRGAAGDRTAERVFAVVAQARSAIMPVLGELGIGLVPVQPPWPRLSYRRDQRRTSFIAGFPEQRSALPAGRRSANHAVEAAVGSAEREGVTNAQVALAWLLRIKVRSADPRHHEAAAARGEHRSGRRRAFGGGSAQHRERGVGDPGAGRALLAAAGGPDRPLITQLNARLLERFSKQCDQQRETLAQVTDWLEAIQTSQKPQSANQ